MALALSITLTAIPALAEWEPDGMHVAPYYVSQGEAVIVPDGTGNVIIVWEDYSIAFDDNIYAQKFDRYGVAQWAAEGVPVCTESSGQRSIAAVSDGAGGVIVAWHDDRAGNKDIYAQRIDADGIVRWTVDGVAVCVFFEDQGNPAIIPDGHGGAVILWEDNWNVVQYDIYGQRVDENGAIIWTPGGISICSAADNQYDISMVADGTGGAIITWQDLRSGTPDIYAQRILIDGTGTARWTTDGVAICEASDSQYEPDLVPDLEGGAIIVWTDWRDSHQDIFAQRVDSLGVIQWEADGINIAPTIAENQYGIDVAQDGSGGVIVAWVDQRDLGVTQQDVYAQRIDSDGNGTWAFSGVPVCTEDDQQGYVTIAADDEGGAFIAWRDYRYGSFDIYAQYMRDDGTALWPAGGIDVCSYEATQGYPVAVADGLGGVVIAWEDSRTGVTRVYAQRIEPRYGHWGVPEPVIAFATDIAPDEGGYVDLSWYGSQLDHYMYGDVTHYSIWRATNPIPPLASSGEFPVLTALQDVGKDFEGEAIRIEQTAAGDFFWEWIANADALGLDGYSYTTPTRTDSTGSDPAMHYFQVVTHTQTPTTYWISAPDSGYSVDNLSPCPPLAVAAEQTYVPEGLEITWEPNTEPDLDGYVIHRGASSDFIPDEGNLVYSECDALFFDSDWRWDNQYWYKLAAIDIHGNVSEYVLLGPGDVTGDETPETPLASYLSQNYPNPFNPVTMIRFGLDSRGTVSLRIYDPAGRLVRTLVDEPLEAGHYTEEWDGRDREGRSVASGMYFYKLQAGTFKETKKMVLLR
jgi:hypothetical protein